MSVYEGSSTLSEEVGSTAGSPVLTSGKVGQEDVPDMIEVTTAALEGSSISGDESESSDAMDVDPTSVTPSGTEVILSTQKVIIKLGEQRDELTKAYGATLTKVGSVQDHLKNAERMQEIKRLNEHIEVLSRTLTSKHSPLGEARQNSNKAGKKTMTGIPLSRSDIPKFNLRHQTENHFPNKEPFDTVDQFLREFEKIVNSAGLDVSEVWLKLIPLSLHRDYDTWLCDDLSKVGSWKQAKLLFQKKFGQSMAKVLARRRIITMRIRPDETASAYHMRFNKGASEAGYTKGNNIVADIFFNSLPDAWQTQVSTVLSSLQKDIDTWEVEDVAQAAINVFGDKVPGSEAGSSDRSNKRKAESFKHGNGPNKRNSSDGSFYCSRHGGNKAAHNEKDCFSVKSNLNKNTKNIFLGNKNTPFKATGNNLCKYCKKDWSHGHKCQEYFARKKQSDRLINSVFKDDNEKHDDDKNEEDDAYD